MLTSELGDPVRRQNVSVLQIFQMEENLRLLVIVLEEALFYMVTERLPFLAL